MPRCPLPLLAVCLLASGLALHGEPPPAEWHSLPIQQGVWRGQPVEYRIWQGWGLIDGDMLVELSNAAKESPRDSVVIQGERYRWPDGIVVYALDPGLRNADRVTRAIQHWEQRTTIRFQRRTSERAYVTIRSVDSGCSANVGMLGNEQFVNLADGCSLGNTIHELGHTLGLFHTQSRLDRDAYVRVRYDNITRPEWSQYVQRLTDGFDSGPYDYGSIMHYPITGFTRNYGASMESSPAGIPMGQRDALSPEDAQAVNLLYQRPLEKVVVTTTPPALSVEVDGSRCTTPCEFAWATGEQHSIQADERQALGATPNSRYDFIRWSDNGARRHEITVEPLSRVYNAQFARKIRILSSVSPPGSGAISLTPASDDGWYPHGSMLTIQATPGDGWRFYRMLPGAGGVTVQGANGLGLSANPSTILATNENLHYVATFTQQPLTTLATAPPGRRVLLNGAVVIGPTSYLWNPGQTFELSVQDPQPVTASVFRHDFSAWSDGGAFTHTIRVPEGSSTITAWFRSLFQMSLSTTSNVSTSAATRPGARNVLISPAPDSAGFLEAGSAFDVRAVNEEGWAFTNWTGDYGGGEALSLHAGDAYLLSANFLSPGLLNASLFVHDATLRPGAIAPGEILTVYVPQAAQILFDGAPGRILERFPNRVRVIVPESVAGRSSALVTIGARSLSLSIVASSPGIYTNRTGAGEAWNDAPARAGEPYSFLASGFAPAMLKRVIVGELDAEILGAEALGDNVTRVSIRLPAALSSGSHPVYLAAGGPYSPPGISITLQ